MLVPPREQQESYGLTATGVPLPAGRRAILGGSNLISTRTAMDVKALFHLAFPVRDLAEARAFYGQLLGCPEGRSSPEWVDFDFYGHQIVAHLSPGECGHRNTSEVDGEDVPVRHFGAVLAMADWERLADKLKSVGTKFLIEPQVRFKGQVGEQATMFFLDPSGNALEFKAFGDLSQVFAH
jgi:extradiol dioxygenase family protein